MKKIYVSAFAVLTSAFMSAQPFWTQTTYKGAFPVTDGTPATDWTNGWTNWDPENANYGATTTTISTNIATSTTLSGVILLENHMMFFQDAHTEEEKEAWFSETMEEWKKNLNSNMIDGFQTALKLWMLTQK